MYQTKGDQQTNNGQINPLAAVRCVAPPHPSPTPNSPSPTYERVTWRRGLDDVADGREKAANKQWLEAGPGFTQAVQNAIFTLLVRRAVSALIAGQIIQAIGDLFHYRAL